MFAGPDRPYIEIKFMTNRLPAQKVHIFVGGETMFLDSYKVPLHSSARLTRARLVSSTSPFDDTPSLPDRKKRHFLALLSHINLDIDFPSCTFVRSFISLLHSVHFPALSDVLHAAPVIPFFECYFRWLNSIDKGDLGAVRKDFYAGCQAISLLLSKHCFLPSEICESSMILSFLQPHFDSNFSEIENGIAAVYSNCLCEGDVPAVILRDFFQPALNYRTFFQRKKARHDCFHFFIRFLQYSSEIPGDAFVSINMCLYDTLTNADTNRYYVDALYVLRAELCFHHESWGFCEPLIPVAILLLRTENETVLRAVWKLFSLIAITEEFPAECLAAQIPYEAIVLNMDSIMPKMGGCALSLLIDFAGRGAVFIDGLIEAGLYDVIGGNFDRPLKSKEKVYRLCRNILWMGGSENSIRLMGQPFFRTLIEEIEGIQRKVRVDFLSAFVSAAQSVAELGGREHLQSIFVENELWMPIVELRNSDDTETVGFGDVLIGGLGSDI
jgi:hypothetical protein